MPLEAYPAAVALACADQVLLGFLGPTRLECRTLEGEFIWGHALSGFHHQYGIPFTVRVDGHGGCWVCGGANLIHLNVRGSSTRKIQIEMSQDEQIGTFVLFDAGFLVATYRSGGEDLTPRLLRLDPRGAVLWETALTAGPISYRGIVSLHFPSGTSEPVPPWRPETWQPNPHAPLLIAGDLLVAGYTDMPASGIGLRYGLSLETGEIFWTTPPAPFQQAAVAGLDRVWIGIQGYGAFETRLFDRAGHVFSWNTHGHYVVDEAGDTRVIEQDNSQRSGWIARILDDGSVIRGDEIPGYYSSNPVLAEDGRIAFWRDDSVYCTDDSLNVTRLCHAKGFANRLLLTNEGLLIFPLTSRDEPRSTSLCLFHSDLTPPALREHPGKTPPAPS
jgi:hypothetical protein